MIRVIGIIVWVLIFYLIYRLAVNIMKIFAENRKAEKVDENIKKSKYKIDKKDIIEADFEEIKPEDKDKSKENI
jgi:hypothetical protein